MNTLEHTPYIWNEKKWYFLSIYYAREKCGKLIVEIIKYYQEHKNLFCAYFISFSKQKGEHLEVTFVSPKNVNNNYSADIQNYFQNYLDKNTSICMIQFPYGKAIWCDYPNNSLVWDNFRATYYSVQYFLLFQSSLFAAVSLNNNDFSENTSFSIGMYLISKSLFCIDSIEQKNVISELIHMILKNTKDKHKVENWVNERVNKYYLDKVSETLASYKNEIESEYSEELMNWIYEIKIFLENKEYKHLYFIICRITGLTTLNQLVILCLLNKLFYI